MSPKLMADIKSESWLDLSKEQPIDRSKWLLRRAQTQVPSESNSNSSTSSLSSQSNWSSFKEFEVDRKFNKNQRQRPKTNLNNEDDRAFRNQRAEVARFRKQEQHQQQLLQKTTTTSSKSGSTCSLTQDHLLIRIRQESFRLSRRRSSFSDVLRSNASSHKSTTTCETSLEHSVKISDLIEMHQLDVDQEDTNCHPQSEQQQQQVTSSRLQRFKSRLERRGRRGSSLLRDSDLQKFSSSGSQQQELELENERKNQKNQQSDKSSTEKDKSLFGYHQRSFSSLGDKFSHLRRSWSKFLSSTHSLHTNNNDTSSASVGASKELKERNRSALDFNKQDKSSSCKPSQERLLNELDDATDPINRLLLTERWLSHHHQLDRPRSLQISDNDFERVSAQFASNGPGDIRSIGRDSSSSTTLVEPFTDSINNKSIGCTVDNPSQDIRNKFERKVLKVNKITRATSLEPNCIRLRNNQQFPGKTIDSNQTNIINISKPSRFIYPKNNQQLLLGVVNGDNLKRVNSRQKFASLKTDTASSISSSRTTTTTGSSSYSFNIMQPNQQQHQRNRRHNRTNNLAMTTRMMQPQIVTSLTQPNLLDHRFAPDEYYFEAANESTEEDEEEEDDEDDILNQHRRAVTDSLVGRESAVVAGNLLALTKHQKQPRGHSVDVSQLSTGGSSSLERTPQTFNPLNGPQNRSIHHNNGYLVDQSMILQTTNDGQQQQQQQHQQQMIPFTTTQSHDNHNHFHQQAIIMDLLHHHQHHNQTQLQSATTGAPAAAPVMDPDYDDYAIPSDENFCRLDRSQVELVQMIGEGQKGFVFLGKLQSRDGRQMIDVAIKTLKYETETMIEKLMHEAAMMRQFEHPHIIRFIGVCPETPALIAMELARFGELRNYLRTNQHLISVSQLVLFSFQISTALSYLESKQFVHRDVAARNVLVCSHTCVKLADFGLSRNLQIEPATTITTTGCEQPASNNLSQQQLEAATRNQHLLLGSDDNSTGHYVAMKPVKLPVRWLAPESLTFRRFTSASDVWMFAVCTWEIFYLGQLRPWAHIANNQVLAAIGAGQRLARPPACPARLYQLLLQCWSYAPVQRPKFRDIKQDLWSIYLSERTREQMLLEEMEREKQETHMLAMATAARQHQQQEQFELEQQREQRIRQILKQQERNRQLVQLAPSAAQLQVQEPEVNHRQQQKQLLRNGFTVMNSPSPTTRKHADLFLVQQQQNLDIISSINGDQQNQHNHDKHSSSSQKSSSSALSSSLARRRRTMFETKQALSSEPLSQVDHVQSPDNTKTRSLRRHQLQKQRSQGSIMAFSGGELKKTKTNPMIAIAQATDYIAAASASGLDDQSVSPMDSRSTREAILQSWHSEKLLWANKNQDKKSRSSASSPVGNVMPDNDRRRHQIKRDHHQRHADDASEIHHDDDCSRSNLQQPAYEGVTRVDNIANNQHHSMQQMSHDFQALQLSPRKLQQGNEMSLSSQQEKERNRELEQRNRFELHRKLLGHIRPASSASSSRARDRANRNSLNVTTSTSSPTSDGGGSDPSTITAANNHNKLQHRPLPSIPANGPTRVESVDQSLEILASLISTTKTTNDHHQNGKFNRERDHQSRANLVPTRRDEPFGSHNQAKKVESELQQEWRRRFLMKNSR